MKFKLNSHIKDYEGKDVVNEKKESITFKDVFSIAINAQLSNKPISAEEKNKIFQLSLKLYSSNEVELNIDELKIIKDKVGEVYSPLIYGRVCQLIEGKTDKK